MFIHTLRMTVGGSGPDTSIKFELAALKIAESNPKFEVARIILYDNVSQFYLDNNKGHRKKDYEKAIYYGNKGIQLALKYNRQRSLTYSYTWVGRAYYFKGERRRGLDYLNKALALCRTLDEPFRVMELYGDLSDCYYFSGNYKQAMFYSQKHHIMNDSLQVHINEKQISELEIKYETAEKDRQIMMLGHDKKVQATQMIVVLFGSLLGIIFSSILILQYRVIRRNNRIIKLSNDKKNKALENIAFIQAHELRRPLASIMGIINVIKAMDYEFDPEYIEKLEKAAEELDEKIHSVLAYVETDTD